ncbi:hypothetical protein ACP70R_043130 [Stipagrostis hirtigluma subsp. patula]
MGGVRRAVMRRRWAARADERRGGRQPITASSSAHVPAASSAPGLAFLRLGFHRSIRGPLLPGSLQSPPPSTSAFCHERAGEADSAEKRPVEEEAGKGRGCVGAGGGTGGAADGEEGRRRRKGAHARGVSEAGEAGKPHDAHRTAAALVQCGDRCGDGLSTLVQALSTSRIRALHGASSM